MLDKAKKLAARARALTERAGSAVTAKAIDLADLNKDGKVDSEDGRIAVERTKEFVSDAADKAASLGNSAMKNDMAKDAATGAAIVAAIAVPVPLIGPVTGAAIGAAVGVAKNLTTKRSTTTSSATDKMPPDVHGEILKLDDLRQRGLLTDAEFEKQKQSILAKGRA